MNCPNCPICGNGNHVVEIEIPTTALLIARASSIGLGLHAAAANLIYTALLTGKRIYKCTKCKKYYIA